MTVFANGLPNRTCDKVLTERHTPHLLLGRDGTSTTIAACATGAQALTTTSARGVVENTVGPAAEAVEGTVAQDKAGVANGPPNRTCELQMVHDGYPAVVEGILLGTTQMVPARLPADRGSLLQEGLPLISLDTGEARPKGNAPPNMLSFPNCRCPTRGLGIRL